MTDKKTFFISDTHFDHKNIIKLAERPFESVGQMNATMISNWNSVVTNNDIVYHLGDFTWGTSPEHFDQLNGEKHLIKGNHDPQRVLDFDWASVSDYKEVREGDKTLILFHYPIYEWHWMHGGSIHLFGHVHQKDVGNRPNSYNVGVEKMEYFPRTLEELIAKSKPLE